MTVVDPYARFVDQLLSYSAALPIWLGISAALVVVVALAVAGEYFGRDWARTVAFVGLCLLLIAWARWPGISLSGRSNPDESFWIASAAALVEDPRPWYRVDTTTGGPLVPIPVMLAGGISGSFGWGTARVAAIGVWLLTLPLLYGAVGLRYGQQVARLAILPVLGSVAFFSNEWEFLSYNSEHVASLLLAAVLYLHAVYISREETRGGARTWILVALGLALGLTPWAKLQVAPIAAVYGLYCMARLLGRSRVRKAVVLAVAAVVPSILIVAIVAAIGVLDDFWISYVAHNLHYASAGLSGMFGGEQVSLLAAVGHYPIDLIRHPDVLPLIGTSCALAIIVIFQLLRRDVRLSLEIVFAFLLVTVGVWTTLQTRQVFGHYLLLLVVPLTFFNGVLIYACFQRGPTTRGPRLGRVALTLVMFAFVVPAAVSLSHPNRAFDPAARNVTPVSDMAIVATAIDSLTDHGDRVAIWGWAAPLWITSRTLPGTRDVHTARQLLPGAMQPYFVERFASDLRHRKPALFVDVAAWYPPFSDSMRYGYHNFPAVARVVSEDYELVAESDRTKIFRRLEQSDATSTGRSGSGVRR